MKNHVQRGENITLLAPVSVLSGNGLLVGAMFGVAAGDAAIGEDLDLVTVGVFTLPKVSAQVMAVGDPLYWDAAAKLVTKTASGNTKIGVAVETVAAQSGTVAVRLNGSF
ncbi:DUF2190 family protein [Methylobacterium bullatum]|uniref:DUF2190 family protein n=1 Tax=Methylobacterium bullatum TaxID=570505 RepID=A0AAV4ZD68_9HYPH|nr:DUF2190 family protein [Methylobacterium bullatum]MBD8902908.1 hypothetical protein [Methylobacterium bullatum]GJD41945.1 hypothetical protein OICFNHDK_4431 [Methylobacterium bullatum]